MARKDTALQLHAGVVHRFLIPSENSCAIRNQQDNSTRVSSHSRKVMCGRRHHRKLGRGAPTKVHCWGRTSLAEGKSPCSRSSSSKKPRVPRIWALPSNRCYIRATSFVPPHYIRATGFEPSKPPFGLLHRSGALVATGCRRHRFRQSSTISLFVQVAFVRHK